MSFDASKLAGAAAKSLRPYKAGMTTAQIAIRAGISEDEVVKLSSNENAFGPSPKAVEAASQSLEGVHLYESAHALEQAISAHLAVRQENIAVGAGTTELIDLIARVFLGPDTSAVISEYAFAMYRTATLAAGGEVISAPASGYGHDCGALLGVRRNDSRIIWIANPNNPTGTFIPYPEIRRFLEKVPYNVLVVLDEAYYEYLDKTDKAASHHWVSDFPNLIVLRTFSKIHGLAGLRIGYAVADSSVIDLIKRVKQPFNVTGTAIAPAAAALKDASHAAMSAKKNREGRSLLIKNLSELGLQMLPAYGNFVTVKFPDAAKMYERLLASGISVRPLTPYGMDEYLRITVGTDEQNRTVIGQIESILKADG